MYRSTIGFEFRAVGANPDGGTYAGMNVAWIYVGGDGGVGRPRGNRRVEPDPRPRAVPCVSRTSPATSDSMRSRSRCSVDHIRSACFSRPALRRSTCRGREMQGAAGIPIDLVLVLQASIIVMIAAPDLVRAIYRIKAYRRGRPDDLDGVGLMTANADPIEPNDRRCAGQHPRNAAPQRSASSWCAGRVRVVDLRIRCRGRRRLDVQPLAPGEKYQGIKWEVDSRLLSSSSPRSSRFSAGSFSDARTSNETNLALAVAWRCSRWRSSHGPPPAARSAWSACSVRR